MGGDKMGSDKMINEIITYLEENRDRLIKALEVYCKRENFEFIEDMPDDFIEKINTWLGFRGVQFLSDDHNKQANQIFEQTLIVLKYGDYVQDYLEEEEKTMEQIKSNLENI